VRVLLGSTYELGHQPLHIASAGAALLAAGHDVRAVDLAIDMLDPDDLGWAEAVALSVPMHTATRLAVVAASRIRAQRPEVPMAAFGLYAGAGAEHPSWSRLFDQSIAGEYEGPLAAWADGLCGGARQLESPSVLTLGRRPAQLPARHLLAPLDRYARLLIGGEERIAGYVELSRGCSHRCRHCPVPVVYDGRVRPVDQGVVVGDIDQLVEAGARHVTFGDPDFLNMPHHSMDVVRKMHARHPSLTFDVTAKVEHILRHAGLWEELAEAGLLFVVSAFESATDDILARLRKGHTVAEAAQATRLLGSWGIDVRPSLLPFTPWTTVGDVVAILDFMTAHQLVANVDLVQYAIRLLLPPGSLLLDDDQVRARLGPFDPEMLGYPWTAEDPALDELATELGAIAAAAASDASPRGLEEVWARVSHAAHDAGTRPPRQLESVPSVERPRLSEPWFCCAEPTGDQLGALGLERTASS
jgi:radical SAM superfamily enzyme YgiQ (UPF0313 family)